MLRVVGKGVRAACCRGAELCVWNVAKKFGSIIPDVSEYEPIASFCYYTGMHHHRGFQLLVEICAITGEFLKSKCAVEVVAGRNSVMMSDIPISSKGFLETVGSRGSIKVSPGDTIVQLVVYRKYLVTKKRVATVVFNIEKEILQADFPKNRWYTLKHDCKVVGRVRLSFHELATRESVVDCLVLQQALLRAQDYKNAGNEINTKINGDRIMLEHEKLYLFSFALEGALIAKDNYVSEMRYFKVVLRNGAWLWSYWNSQSECREYSTPQGSIPILSISTVLRHPTDYTSFYIKFYTKEEAKDLILKTLDRSRDVWSDALYFFIQQTRFYLEHFENFSAFEDMKMV
ncbi:hypothetical protein BgAZ_400600 [Babesia gibsoni]|uniref:CERLI1-like PH domain-containing protein n=1 Tax=Babesia gibsoni TaxID=33632 RepID=A0AAD8LR43_BABGI|nr:hypothetical protein BgAZ_400600 [Babesia gibsoni]